MTVKIKTLKKKLKNKKKLGFSERASAKARGLNQQKKKLHYLMVLSSRCM